MEEQTTRILTSPRFRNTCSPNGGSGPAAAGPVAGRACPAAIDPPTRRRSIESVMATGGRNRASAPTPAAAVDAQTVIADPAGARIADPIADVTGAVADAHSRAAGR